MDLDRMSLTSMGMRQMFDLPGSDIRKTGVLKKLKSHRPQTLKKKFFVLRSTSASGPARLEYYDSEKKFKAGNNPKRSIELHTCFNINRRSDSSIPHHGSSSGSGKSSRGHGLVVYLSDESITMMAETEEEMESWLHMLLDYQHEFLPDGDMQREHYEHVWQVVLQARGLGEGNKGRYRLCLNTSTLCLVKMSCLVPHFSIPLVTIRSVAFSECMFRIIVGKIAPTGQGEFSFTAEDSSTAKDVHNTISHYMNNIKNPSGHKDTRHSSPGHRRPTSMIQRPASYHSQHNPNWVSMETVSPTSPGGHAVDFSLNPHRTRSDTGESRDSRASSYFDDHPDFAMSYNGSEDHKEQFSVVPEDMSPPSSPTRLDDEVSAYLEMDMSRQRQSSVASGSSPTSVSTPMTSSYHSQKGELPGSDAYTPMTPMHSQTPLSLASSGPPPLPSHVATHPVIHPHTAPIPIHTHSYSDPHHSTPLPTVKEGGSTEGYAPMDSSSPVSSMSTIVRPGPAKCMLSDDSTTMHPRTYSLGSKPHVKKYTGYVEMGPGGAGGKGSNDMPRATSVPHIILKGGGRRGGGGDSRSDQRSSNRGDRDSPTASPLSMSLRSDDSEDSFMDYTPMRPRTVSDGFNYNRPRTTSFGNRPNPGVAGVTGSCRPRSSSHGQGTRPVLSGRLAKKQDPAQSLIRGDHHRVTSQTSSPHGSFDSLRVSNESLRRLSLSEGKASGTCLSRQQSGSNASDYSDARGTPSPKGHKTEADGYVNMQPGGGSISAGQSNLGVTSSHRMRTDSASSSGRKSDSSKSNSFDRLHHHNNQSDYTEMAPIKSSGSIGSATGGGSGDAYMSMSYKARHSFSSDTRPMIHHSSMPSAQHRQQSQVQSGNQNAYMSMEMPTSRIKPDQGAKSASMENVDTYVVHDPAHPKLPTSVTSTTSSGNNSGKPRTGSLGSKDKSGNSVRPGSSRRPSSNSTSSVGGSHYGAGLTVSTSTRAGGSSDSIRSKSSTSTSRQSSIEKHGSLGRDFRKKSASMGSRPVSTKSSAASGSGKSSSFTARSEDTGLHPREVYLQQHQMGNYMNARKTQKQIEAEAADEYVEFSPTATIKDSHPHGHTPSSHSQGIHIPSPSTTSGGLTLSRSPNTVSMDENESGYTMYNPGASPGGHGFSLARIANVLASSTPQLFTTQTPAGQASSRHSIHTVTTTSSRSHQGHHHQHGSVQSPSASSTSKVVAASSTHHPSTKPDDSDYVGYQPGSSQLTASPSPSTTSSAPGRAAGDRTETKPESEYVGYEPGVSLSGQGMSLAMDTSEYVGYDPSKLSQQTSNISALSPNSAISYIQAPPPSNPSSHQSKSSQSSMPHHKSPKSPSSPASSSSTSPPSAVAPVDDSEYMGYNPALPASTLNSAPTTVVSSSGSAIITSRSCMKENMVPTPTRAVSYIEADTPTTPSDRAGVTTPLSVDVNISSSDRNTRASSTPPVSAVSVQPFALSSSDNIPTAGKNLSRTNSGSTKQKAESRQQHQQQLGGPINRQMSSPANPSGGQPDCPSPSLASQSSAATRHKHLSGSSTSSKSKRGVCVLSSSTDSLENSMRGGKSDSNSSLNSSSSSLRGNNGKRRLPSDGGGSAEKSPMSSTTSRGESSGETCTIGDSMQLSSRQLEAKILPVESRIRHSLGDMTSVVGVSQHTGGKDSGLIRPGSSPCMQNLDSATPTPGAVTPGGSTISSAEPECDSHTSWSRRSLSDLNSAMGGGVGGGGDQASTSRLLAQQPKPLNYVKLDLSSSSQEPQACGDAPEGTKTPRGSKSRNSSDADEKQPPLSYAEIDFVKSQNLSKALQAMGGGPGDDSSKS